MLDSVSELSAIDVISRKETFDLNSLIESLIFSFSVGISEKKIDVSCNFPSDHKMVTLDRHGLTVIMKAFISNAIKFTSANGHVCVGYTEHGDSLTVFVKDDGIGIDASLHGKVFEKYFKVNTFTDGLGLGLSVVDFMAASMAAKIQLTSELAKGSTFSVMVNS